jgi:hypothetical protein
MFAKKRQPGNLDFSGCEVLHFRRFDHVPEAALLEHQLERRILQLSAPAAWNNDVFDFVTDLQKRLKKHMVLVIVGDQHVVDGIRQVNQVNIGIP